MRREGGDGDSHGARRRHQVKWIVLWSGFAPTRATPAGSSVGMAVAFHQAAQVRRASPSARAVRLARLLERRPKASPRRGG